MSDAMKAPVEGVAPPQEDVKDTAPAVSPEQDPRLEALARKEKAIRHQARELQQMKAQIEAQKASMKPDTSWRDRLKTNFMDVVAEAGLTHEEVTQHLLNTSNTDLTIKQLQSKIAELEAKQGETLSKFEAGQKTAFDQAKAQVSREVKMLVDSDEAFETVKAYSAHDAVVELIVQTYQEDGILLSAEEAAKQVEDHLLEEATTIAKLKKVQGRLAPPVDAGKPAPTKESAMKTGTPQKTLTHAAVSNNSASMTAKERRERAIAAFRGTLK